MSEIRKIKTIVTGKNTVDGAGVNLVRVFGFQDTKEFDPFLMLDAFDSENPDDYIKGFPWHPHRGIETVTYLVNGVIQHGDSLGHLGNITDGQCQWMTAGSGIIHQEMPKATERLLGIQLWINMPAKYKMSEPKYRTIFKGDIPIFDEDGALVRVIAGTYEDSYGAINGEFVDAQFLDVQVDKDREWKLDTEKGDNLFVYLLDGDACFGDSEEIIKSKHVVLFEDGEKFKVKAGSYGVRFLLLAAKPLKEPVAWGGPIVMNTEEEVHQAFQELEDNSFIKQHITTGSMK